MNKNKNFTTKSKKECDEGEITESEGEDSDLPLDPNIAEVIPNIPSQEAVEIIDIIPLSSDEAFASRGTTDETVSAERDGDNELNIDTEHLPLDDAIVESVPEIQAQVQMDESHATGETLGRVFDDTGRVVSSRGKKPTQQLEDFVYKCHELTFLSGEGVM